MSEQILFDDSFRSEVENAASAAEDSVTAISAYVKCPAISWLASAIENRSVEVSLVAGWSIADLVTGASDVNAYSMTRSLGWKFGILPGLHAKVYIIDHKKIFIGSANLTPSGLQLSRVGNIEAGVMITPTNIDLVKLSALVEQVIWLDDRLFSEIKEKVDQAGELQNPHNRFFEWPESIQKIIDKMTKYLWVNDCFLTEPELIFTRSDNDVAAALIQHDRYLLGRVEVEQSPEQLQEALRRVSITQWLIEVLKNEPDKSARFGRLSSKLHDALLDDPKPYRKDVKNLLSNLVLWIEYAEMPEFELVQHRHTRTVRLTAGYCV